MNTHDDFMRELNAKRSPRKLKEVPSPELLANQTEAINAAFGVLPEMGVATSVVMDAWNRREVLRTIRDRQAMSEWKFDPFNDLTLVPGQTKPLRLTELPEVLPARVDGPPTPEELVELDGGQHE